MNRIAWFMSFNCVVVMWESEEEKEEKNRRDRRERKLAERKVENQDVGGM